MTGRSALPFLFPLLLSACLAAAEAEKEDGAAPQAEQPAPAAPPPDPALVEKARAEPLAAFPVDLPVLAIPAQTVPRPGIQMHCSFMEDLVVDGKLKIAAFRLGRTEVTNRQWRQFEKWFALTGSHRFCSPLEPKDYEHAQAKEESGAYAPLYGDDLPACGVSFFDAWAFCGFAGGRLPTELEWVSAAYWSGSSWNTFPWGNSGEKDRKVGSFANYQDLTFVAWQQKNGIAWEFLDASVDEKDKFPLAAPVGSFPGGKTGRGLLDMAGNAAEWVDGRGVTGGRPVRGGDWGKPLSFLAREGQRAEHDPLARLPYVGFRLLMDEPRPKGKGK